jgi:hypothetical protein
MNLPKKKSSILTRCPYCEKKIGLDTIKPVLDSEGMRQLADQIEEIFSNPVTGNHYGKLASIKKVCRFLRGD